MKKRLFIAVFLFALLVHATAQSTGLFHTEEERIIDANGQVFVPHGVNVNGPRWAWSNTGTPLSTKGNSIKNVWGFNAVRVVWRRYEDRPNQGTGFTMDEYIQEYVVNRGLLVMIDLQDYLGENNFTPEWHQQTIEHWIEMAQKYGVGVNRSGSVVNLTEEQASMIWFNIHNEPISSNTNEQMVSLKERYEAVIDTIRALGAQNIFVLDGSTYANEYQSPTFNKTYGPHFVDKYENIIMSVHYGKSDWTKATWQNYMQWFVDRNIPLLGGEISQAAPGKDIRTTHAFYGDESSSWATGGFTVDGAGFEVGVGGFYWHFYGGDDGDLTTSNRGWLVNDDTNPTNLTEEGKIIWADIRRGDKNWTAPCGGDGCADDLDTEPPSPPENLQVSYYGSEATITWSPSTDNIEVTGYILYDGDGALIKKFNTANTSVVIPDLSPGVTYTYRISAYDAEGNESDLSEILSVVLPEEPSSIDKSRGYEFELFPNPNDGNFIIKSNTQPDILIDLYVYDLNGRQLHAEKSLNLKQDFPVSLETESGSYVVKIIETKNASLVYTQNIIVAK